MLPGNEDFIFGPILAGLVTLRDARDGVYDLADFAHFNDALSVKAENEWRAQEAAKRGG